jgi:hypothetical protein
MLFPIYDTTILTKMKMNNIWSPLLLNLISVVGCVGAEVRSGNVF